MAQVREYRIISKIGEGGMGEVFLAEDENLGRKVAIKMLAPELMRNAELVERFKQEAKLQSSLLHPNIVALYTFFIEGGNFYMVMEYAEGETLSQRLKRVGLLPPHICLPIFNQILTAVGYAHSKGIIHRDLKPSNIMINQDDKIKIMDFGIAKALGNNNITKTGTKMGTVNYMSPEQIVGDKDIDHRSDIYSLGVVFFEMLTGKLPYKNTTSSEFLMMQEIVQTKLPSVKEFYPYVPEKVDVAIAKATKKDREQRFKNCDEFAKFFEIEDDKIAEEKNKISQNINLNKSSFSNNSFQNQNNLNNNFNQNSTNNSINNANVLFDELFKQDVFRYDYLNVEQKDLLYQTALRKINVLPLSVRNQMMVDLENGVTSLGCTLWFVNSFLILFGLGLYFIPGIIALIFAARYIKGRQLNKRLQNLAIIINKYERGHYR